MRSIVITKTRLVWSSVHKAMQEPNRTSVHRTYIFQAFPNPKGKNVSLGLQGFRMFQNTITSWGLEDTTVYYSILGSYIWMSRWCNMMQYDAMCCNTTQYGPSLLMFALPCPATLVTSIRSAASSPSQGQPGISSASRTQTATYCNILQPGYQQMGKAQLLLLYTLATGFTDVK